MTPNEATRIRELDIPGIELTTEARRYYPNRHLAAHLSGFADIDGRGIEGIELAYEEQLRGSDRRVEAIRDRRGHVVFADDMEDDRTIQGQSVVLTIDKAIQHIAERELALGVRTFEARGGSVVVMDPSSGEILALANYPPFNPNEPSKHPIAHRRNRAVVDRFEPGSTVKPFTMAAALAAGAVKPNQSINCENGVTRWGDASFTTRIRTSGSRQRRSSRTRATSAPRRSRSTSARRNSTGGFAVSGLASRPASACPARPRASFGTTGAGTRSTRRPCPSGRA